MKEDGRRGIPTREEAEALLAWAGEQNPGPWVEHSRTAARAAEGIAAAAGLDAERAYVSGLLHDIGRYEGVRALHHVVAGYQLMQARGYAPIARICLTHSFPLPELESYCGAHDCSPEELAWLEEAIAAIDFDDYDRLIQLCDALSLPDSVVHMDTRLLDVARRYPVNDKTREKWDRYGEIKADFDRRCGQNIYLLFREEISAAIFGD